MNSQSPPEHLILASTSPYRKELLQRFGLPFECRAPNVDETPAPRENAGHLTARLALAKANSVSRLDGSAVVIGSDQVAEFEGRVVGKPGNAENAASQLLRFSGRTVRFLTAVAVVCIDRQFSASAVVETEVRFRVLDRGEIDRYLAMDQPLDCAGSFKSEAAGPLLLEAMISSDPTAIIGLPLITLGEMLRGAGFRLP